MDAESLDFPDSSFDSVTFFYSFMFMSTETRKKLLKKWFVCSKKGGEIHIWDVNIKNAEKEPFNIDLKICLPEEIIETTYGVMGFGLEQSFEKTKDIFENLNLRANM